LLLVFGKLLFILLASQPATALGDQLLRQLEGEAIGLKEIEGKAAVDGRQWLLLNDP
jgi:hypothetical protein